MTGAGYLTHMMLLYAQSQKNNVDSSAYLLNNCGKNLLEAAQNESLNSFIIHTSAQWPTISPTRSPTITDIQANPRIIIYTHAYMRKRCAYVCILQRCTRTSMHLYRYTSVYMKGCPTWFSVISLIYFGFISDVFLIHFWLMLQFDTHKLKTLQIACVVDSD